MKILTSSIILLQLQLCVRAADLDTATVERLSGLKGKWNAEEKVFKITQPRADVKVVVDGFPMSPFLGLTSWAAFKSGMKEEAMVMGDLVLLQDEVNTVMSAALEQGLEVTALHNHFFFDEPKIYFMHIGGDGPLEKLARGVGALLAAQKGVRAKNPEAAASFGRKSAAGSSIDASEIQGVLGIQLEAKDGMAKATFGRVAKMPCGCDAGKEMGINTWAAFAGSPADAIVDGDFIVTAAELQPVLKALRRANINIVAIHQHMTQEEPRYIFLHYWGRGVARELAKSIKAALDLTQR